MLERAKSYGFLGVPEAEKGEMAMMIAPKKLDIGKKLVHCPGCKTESIEVPKGATEGEIRKIALAKGWQPVSGLSCPKCASSASASVGRAFRF